MRDSGLSASFSDVRGYVPNLSWDEEAIRLIVRAIQKSGYRSGEHFAVAIDAAGGEMYNEAKAVGEEGQYYFWEQNRC